MIKKRRPAGTARKPSSRKVAAKCATTTQLVSLKAAGKRTPFVVRPWKTSTSWKTRVAVATPLAREHPLYEAQQLVHHAGYVKGMWHGCKVRSVHHVLNPVLLERFAASQQRLGPAFKWVIAYHGTSESNLKSICKHGFFEPADERYRMAHGQSWGPGIYLAGRLSCAIAYAPKQANVLACAVLVGTTCVFDPLVKTQRCDSFCDADRQMIIVPRSANILPLFLICL